MSRIQMRTEGLKLSRVECVGTALAVAVLASTTARAAGAQGATTQPPAAHGDTAAMAGMAGMNMSKMDMSKRAGHDSAGMGRMHGMAGMQGMAGMHGTGVHGGQLAMAGTQHVELHATPAGDLHVWLYDAAMKAITVPATASVVLTSGRDSTTVPLAADPAARMLMGRFDATKYASATAVVHLAAGAGTGRSARFTLAAPHAGK